MVLAPFGLSSYLGAGGGTPLPLFLGAGGGLCTLDLTGVLLSSRHLQLRANPMGLCGICCHAYHLKFCLEYVTVPFGFKFLFFTFCAFIFITGCTCVIRKDGDGTSIYFFVQN
jgi:hypothetical protein